MQIKIIARFEYAINFRNWMRGEHYESSFKNANLHDLNGN